MLITRTRDQASALAARLEALGAEAVLVPTIELAAPLSFAALDAAIAALRDPANTFDCLIFTSANAVYAAADRAGLTPGQGSTLFPKRIAAIGPATAKAIRDVGIVPLRGEILSPPKFVAESLAQTLIAEAGGEGRHYLLVRAEAARDVLPLALEAAGHRVTIAAAYRNVTPGDTLPTLARIFAAPQAYPAVATFTSSSTARNLIDLLASAGLAIPPEVALASIGPITSATLRELGYEHAFEAAEPTIDSLALAIAAHLGLSWAT